MKAAGRIKIAHVCWQLDLGGLERLLLDFAGHVNARDFDLQFICLNGGGAIAKQLELMGSKVSWLPAASGPRLHMVARLSEIFSESRVQIVHTHNNGPLIHAAPAARLVGAKVVHTRHGQGMGTSRPQQVLVRAASHLIDRFVCVSADSARIATREGLCPQRISVIRNGVDLGQFEYHGPNREGPVVVVARLTPEKDISSLIRATALVVRDHPQMRLRIAGDGPARVELQNLVDELNMRQHIEFVGVVKNVSRLLQSASLFVLPSLSEGLSLSILEAMATGLPVIAMRVGGNPEVIIEDRTGLLVSPGDAFELAEAISRLLGDPVRARCLGAAGRKHVECHFDVRQMIDRYEGFYRQIIRSRGSASRAFGTV
jgi:glycosyltransferase involved in cell wall biosynthesis